MKSLPLPLQHDADRQLIATLYDPHVIEAVGERLVVTIAEHLQLVQSATGPVLNWCEPDENVRDARTCLEQGDAAPIDERDELLARMDELVRQCLAKGLNLHHPHYVGQTERRERGR